MKKFFKDFSEFLFKGNLVALATGVVVGASVNALVTALTNSFILPLIGMATGEKGNALATLKFTIAGSDFLYGEFISALIIFIITMFVLFMLLRFMKRMSELLSKEEAAKPADPSEEILLLRETVEQLKQLNQQK